MFGDFPLSLRHGIRRIIARIHFTSDTKGSFLPKREHRYPHSTWVKVRPYRDVLCETMKLNVIRLSSRFCADLIGEFLPVRSNRLYCVIRTYSAVSRSSPVSSPV